MRKNIILTLMALFVMPLALTACSSNKDLGDSDGITIGEPEALPSGEYTGGGVDDYNTAPIGGVDSSTIGGSQSDLVAQAGDIVFFETDQHGLTSQGRNVLDAQAQWLNNYPNVSVIIEGHADERGTREYNLALGERRAISSKNYLIAVGVDPRRVDTVSYGKEQPLVVGNDGQTWSQNRRARTRVQ